ncbi:DUF4345 family protein [Frankia sp. AgB1.9]|uniref:DUF4345 family protein n=1 Tax=unclassified Frankia TaxID=2632575 RepID=UPI00193280A4|nr:MULTISPECIES: DUF4345 family protein [unclassified Frankia]MBL7488344.1 DUF4345 family protein [Frankia sp. AgW1.1]MBL7548501.1 DUF4345 family protein [Frankia sp. AgB1.9]MBL7619602.1 DUF4345 family protein [Frankia sp. AgB1.8]
MNAGRISSAALMAAGLAGVVMPVRFAAALDLPATTGRGRTETRAGLGGTYAALGGWALVSREPVARRAVGVAWLGAAAVRLGSTAVDRPRTDWVYWASLAMELGFGATALAPLTRPGPAPSP